MTLKHTAVGTSLQLMKQDILTISDGPSRDESSLSDFSIKQVPLLTPNKLSFVFIYDIVREQGCCVIVAVNWVQNKFLKFTWNKSQASHLRSKSLKTDNFCKCRMFHYRVSYDSDYERAQVVRNELKNLRLECNLLQRDSFVGFNMSRYIFIALFIFWIYSKYSILYVDVKYPGR